jgi:hypothetical protein
MHLRQAYYNFAVVMTNKWQRSINKIFLEQNDISPCLDERFLEGNDCSKLEVFPRKQVTILPGG